MGPGAGQMQCPRLQCRRHSRRLAGKANGPASPAQAQRLKCSEQVCALVSRRLRVGLRPTPEAQDG